MKMFRQFAEKGENKVVLIFLRVAFIFHALSHRKLVSTNKRIDEVSSGLARMYSM